MKSYIAEFPGIDITLALILYNQLKIRTCHSAHTPPAAIYATFSVCLTLLITLTFTF